MAKRIELGDLARDTVTGFEGIVTGDYSFLHGCRRLALQPRELKDGKPLDSITFDELQLELVATAEVLADQRPKKTGGPRADPQRRQDPTR